MARDYERDGIGALVEELGRTSRQIEELYEKLAMLRFAVRDAVNSLRVDEEMDAALRDLTSTKAHLTQVYLGTIHQPRTEDNGGQK